MLDVDGTLVPYNYNALPSRIVAQAVKKAQERVTVCTVTGRSYAFTKKVLQKLQIQSGYAVVNNGAQVVELATEDILYDQPLSVADTQAAIEVLFQENVPFYLKQEHTELAFLHGHFKKGEQVKKPYMFFTDEVFPLEKIDHVLKLLSPLSNLTVQKTHHKYPEKYGLCISHVKATKLHGIQIVKEKLQIEKEEIIGVGDSYNDFPLLMASGTKVAMGNAVEDLKAIADYIAPSVNEDGVANVIEKFIYSS